MQPTCRVYHPADFNFSPKPVKKCLFMGKGDAKKPALSYHPHPSIFFFFFDRNSPLIKTALNRKGVLTINIFLDSPIADNSSMSIKLGMRPDPKGIKMFERATLIKGGPNELHGVKACMVPLQSSLKKKKKISRTLQT